MNDKLREDVKGNGPSLFEENISAYAWRDRYTA
jgi:hypothetical protein